jgi:hypothetical protein
MPEFNFVPKLAVKPPQFLLGPLFRQGEANEKVVRIRFGMVSLATSWQIKDY